MANPDRQGHSEPLEPQHPSVEIIIGEFRRGSKRSLLPVILNDPSKPENDPSKPENDSRKPKKVAKEFINSLPGIKKIR